MAAVLQTAVDAAPDETAPLRILRAAPAQYLELRRTVPRRNIRLRGTRFAKSADGANDGSRQRQTQPPGAVEPPQTAGRFAHCVENASFARAAPPRSRSFYEPERLQTGRTLADAAGGLPLFRHRLHGLDLARAADGLYRQTNN